MYPLGRNPMKYDMRDYRMLDYLTLSQSQPTSKLWTLKTILDQGNTPHCVGFAWAHYGLCEPIVDNFTGADADKIYYEAKVVDNEPGQENGSTTRSGVQAMQKRGRISTYVFASSLNDIISWLLLKGPVVTGTNWTYDMFHPDSKGFIQPTGEVAGGHEYLIVGANTSTKVLTFANSWGDWADHGFFYMSFADYQKLLKDAGDACAAMELPLIPTPSNPWIITSQKETEIVLSKP